MRPRLRWAVSDDAAAFVSIKQQLPIPGFRGSTTRGGFLLGADLSSYLYYIREAHCMVAELDSGIIGFGIMFGDDMVRGSDLWKRKEEAGWFVDPESFQNKRICYFEQLAFVGSHARTAIRLSFHLINWMFRQGHELMITTTVAEPVKNLAALPLILAAGGRRVGRIIESYPDAGEIVSDIHMLEVQSFDRMVQAHPLHQELKGSIIPDK